VSPHPKLLDAIPLFASMDDDERTALAAIMDEVSFKVGQIIYRAADVGGTLYILISGEVEMSIEDDDGKKVVIDVLKPGDFCGELSLLDGGNRSATVITTQPTRTLVLTRNHLVDLLMKRPHMAQDMMMWLVKRIRRTDGLLRRRVSRDPNEVIEERETLGNRVADKVASFGGSWTFISLFGLVLVAWVIVNTVLLGEKAFDVYPFILLNLFLSMLAAIQAPIIMMSQNRQDAKDRIRSELDYQVNLKAELEVTEVLRRMDGMQDALDELRSGRHGGPTERPQ
jgi:CRP/FNR family transcriptional regulator, cyclic AMP receptor protein